MAYDILTPSELASAGAVFSLLCILLSSIRLLTKRKLHAGWGPDDWLIIPACVRIGTAFTLSDHLANLPIQLMVVGMGVATIIGRASPSRSPDKSLTHPLRRREKFGGPLHTSARPGDRQLCLQRTSPSHRKKNKHQLH